MPDPLDVREVERIAALAHLALTEDEKQLFGRQLAAILAYAEQVNEVDTTGIPPTTHVLGSQPLLRRDDPTPSLTQEEALENAPDSAAGFFKVPRVIG